MKRPLYLFASLAAVMSILASACAGTSTPTTTTAPPTTTTSAPPTTSAAPPTTTKAPPTTTAATTADNAKPQYGGTLNEVLTADITNWDSGLNGNAGALADLVYNQYMSADWTLGPAGKNTTNFAAGTSSVDESEMPMISDHWTMPQPGVWVLHIRQGVYWQNPNTDAGKLMNGREVTADDVVSSFNRLIQSPTSWIDVGQPAIAKASTIAKTGDWEVTIKTPVDYLTSWTWLIQGAGFARLYPPEVVAKYGNMGDWHNAIGTGPFILTDYVKGSSLTFAKNPTYWETNEAGPGKGDKLPYVDTLKQLIIPDLSTRISAFRTGQLDIMDGGAALASVDAQPLFKANPKIESLKFLSGTPWAITMRTDKQSEPFANTPNGLKVRQALMMGTDFNGLSQTLFGGDAETDVWPVNKYLTNMFTPLSQMPQAVQNLYVYNPTAAKQLLSDAGYPNGFSTTVTVSNVDQTKIDDLTAFQAQWAKIGVTLNIQTEDNATYTKENQARSDADMSYRFLWATFAQQMYFSPERGPSTNNPSFVNDPAGSIPDIESLYTKIQSQIFVDWPGAFSTYKQLKPILLSGAWYIVRPTPYTYNVWWPYVGGYYGQSTVSFSRYIWIDQNMKKTLGF